MHSHKAKMKEFKKYIHSNIAQFDELTTIVRRNWAYGKKAEMTVSTTNGIITAQMSMEIGKARKLALALPLRELRMLGEDPTDLLENKNQEKCDGGATERRKKSS